MMNNDIIQRAVHPDASHMQGITLQTGLHFDIFDTKTKENI